MDQFKDFEAQSLYCPRCKAARPVRERLLLIMPDYELNEYLCTACHNTVGTRKVMEQRSRKIILG